MGKYVQPEYGVLDQMDKHEARGVFEGNHVINTTHPVFDCEYVSLEGGYVFPFHK